LRALQGQGEPDHLKLVAKLYTVPPAVIKNAVHVTSTAFGKKP
jgi:hypothetical protein